jgi:hypothetical protein
MSRFQTWDNYMRLRLGHTAKCDPKHDFNPPIRLWFLPLRQDRIEFGWEDTTWPI